MRRHTAGVVPMADRASAGSEVVPAYERALDGDPGWALSEGSRFFEGRSAVQDALRKIVRRLDELGIAYAVSGGLALFAHGYRRFTEDVDILVTSEGLKAIHAALEGRGYLPPFSQSKHLRDTELGVCVKFSVAGQFPGDGRPKPVAFPDPAITGIEIEGIKYLNLVALVQLKLASGMTAPGRMRDLSDVMELIKVLQLPYDFAEKLDPYVRDKYQELWQTGRTRYVKIWRSKDLLPEARSLEEMIGMLRQATDTLKAMLSDGVTLDPGGGTGDDYALLVTTDPEIARKYDMHEESEFWDPDEEPDSVPE